MMTPTARVAFIFEGGVPFALILVAAEPELWSLSFDFGVLVLVGIAIDPMTAFPPRRLAVATKRPERLFVGESAAFAVEIEPSPYARPTRFVPGGFHDSREKYVNISIWLVQVRIRHQLASGADARHQDYANGARRRRRGENNFRPPDLVDFAMTPNRRLSAVPCRETAFRWR
jgi:hypothetical protein